MGCCGKHYVTKGKNILIGWFNLLRGLSNEEIKKRMTACKNCSENRSGGRRMWCGKCGKIPCYIPAKIRVKKEKCSLGKW